MDSCHTTPFFSVLIPVYNAANFLQFTLNSVYNQTFQDFEIIAIDDGSTDNSYEILTSQNDSRLRIYRQENSGVSATRNRAIREAKGKYIAMLDSDDAWMEDHLELAARFFNKYPEYVWYLTNAPSVKQIADDDLKAPQKRTGSYMAMNWFLEAANIPMCSSCFILRELIKEDFFPVGIKMYEDNVAFSRFAMQHPMIGYATCHTAYYRSWGGAATIRFHHTRKLQQTGVELDALLEHQKLFCSNNCPKEAKLYFQYFSYRNWWGRIRSQHLLPWITEMKARKIVTGKTLTLWLILFAKLSDLFFRIMGKGVRLKYDSVVRKINREAAKNKVILSPVI